MQVAPNPATAKVIPPVLVRYDTDEKPGTIIVNTPNRFLYYVLPGGKAVRYGIGVGKAGFAWQGEAYIAWKQEWPTWHPPCRP